MSGGSKSNSQSVQAPVGCFHDPAVTSASVVTFDLSEIDGGRFLNYAGIGGNWFCLFTASASAPTFNTNENTDSTAASAYTKTNGEYVNLTPVQYLNGIEYSVQKVDGFDFMHVKAVSDDVDIRVRAS